MKARSGFTLVEVMIALVTTAIVVALARVALTEVVRTSVVLDSVSADTDRRLAAERWVAAAFQSLSLGRPGDPAFEGGPRRVSFGAVLLTESGWYEPRQVTIDGMSDQPVLTWDGGSVALERKAVLEFDYLLVPGEQSRWVREWRSDSDAPVAVRVRRTVGEGAAVLTDTLLFAVGVRG